MSMALLETAWINVDICVFDYVKHDIIYLHVKSYVCSSTSVALSDDVRLWLWDMSIVLGLSLVYYYLDLRVYVEYINDVMNIYRMTWGY